MVDHVKYTSSKIFGLRILYARKITIDTYSLGTSTNCYQMMNIQFYQEYGIQTKVSYSCVVNRNPRYTQIKIISPITI